MATPFFSTLVLLIHARYLVFVFNNRTRAHAPSDTQTWSQPRFKGKVPGPRCRHTMTAVDEKQLVLLGGYKESDNAIYKEIAVLHTGATCVVVDDDDGKKGASLDD